MGHQKYTINNEPIFSLVAEENEYISNKPNYRKPRPGLHPSAASVEYEDNTKKVVIGKCMREAWYSYMDYPADKPASVGLQWKGHLGKWGEQGVVEKWKEMGLWEGNNIKFYNRDLALSGELDSIIRNPMTGKPILIECLSPDSLIIMHDYRCRQANSIPQTVTIGDEIISHNGDIDRVLNTQITQVESEPLYQFRGKFDGLTCKLTGEHPVLVADIQIQRTIKNNKTRSYTVKNLYWKSAKDISRGDYICIPKAKFNNSDENISCTDILANESNWAWEIIDNKIYSKWPSARTRQTGLPVGINNLEAFYWLLGLYLAEGSCSNNTVYFSLHQDETNIVDKIRIIAKSLFSLDIKVAPVKDTRTQKMSKCINVRITSKALRELIKSIIPGNTKNKTKHIKYKYINPKYLSTILHGAWEGDGHASPADQYKISTAVPHLAYLYFQLAAQCNLDPSISQFRQQSQFNSDYIYIVSWSTNTTKNNQEKLVDGGDYWCYKVKKVELHTYTGPVYNLECAPSHTYTAGTLTVHNCKSFYGFPANRSICGVRSERGTSRSIPGQPRDEHFLQTIIYYWEYKDIVDEARLYYLERGDGHRVEFRVGVQEDQGQHTCYWEQVPGKYWNSYQEGRVLQPYSIEDIHYRYKVLLNHLRAKTLPPKDYEAVWDEDTIEYYHQTGEISKSKYDKWKKAPKTNPLGSWRCSYCSHPDRCKQDELLAS